MHKLSTILLTIFALFAEWCSALNTKRSLALHQGAGSCGGTIPVPRKAVRPFSATPYQQRSDSGELPSGCGRVAFWQLPGAVPPASRWQTSTRLRPSSCHRISRIHRIPKRIQPRRRLTDSVQPPDLARHYYLIAEVRVTSTADANERELRKTAKKASESARKWGLSARETKPKATKHHARISATKYYGEYVVPATAQLFQSTPPRGGRLRAGQLSTPQGVAAPVSRPRRLAFPETDLRRCRTRRYSRHGSKLRNPRSSP